MSRFETAFRNAIANAERDVLLEQIRQNPQMTLSELAKLTTGELGKWLRGLTIGDLLSAAGRVALAVQPAAPAPAKAAPAAAPKGKAEPAKAKAAKAKPAKAKPKKVVAAADDDDDDDDDDDGIGANVDTRRPEGRAAYDQAVFAAIQGAGAPIGAEALRRSVGGTSLQARAALGRLIEAGKITWSGQARGTRYEVASPAAAAAAAAAAAGSAA